MSGVRYPTGGVGLGRALYVGPWQEYRLAQLLAEVRRGGEVGSSSSNGSSSSSSAWLGEALARRSADPREPGGVRLDVGAGGRVGAVSGALPPVVGSLGADAGGRRWEREDWRERGAGRRGRVRAPGKKGVKVRVGVEQRRDDQMDKMRRLYGMGGPGRVGAGELAHHGGARWASAEVAAPQDATHQEVIRVPPGTRLAPLPAPARVTVGTGARLPGGREVLPPMPMSIRPEDREEEAGEGEGGGGRPGTADSLLALEDDAGDEGGLLAWAKGLEAADLDLDDDMSAAWG